MTGKVLTDEVFIQKLTKILEDNFSREDFGVPELSEQIGISLIPVCIVNYMPNLENQPVGF